MPLRNPSIRRETVQAYGLTWVRYPDSPRTSDARYFRSGNQRLHRLVWEVHHGPIPDGYHVHHKDGDHGNNAIDNLELLPEGEHTRHHLAGRCNDAQRANLERIRHLAAAWHASPEGREWHRRHGRHTLAAVQPREKTCERCGVKYMTKKASGKLCSPRCRAAALRARRSAVRAQHDQ